MGIAADFADFVFRSAILNIKSYSFLMLLAIEAGLIVGPEVLSCSSGGGSIVWFKLKAFSLFLRDLLSTHQYK